MKSSEKDVVDAAVRTLEQWMERETAAILGARAPVEPRYGKVPTLREQVKASALERRDEFYALVRSLKALTEE